MQHLMHRNSKIVNNKPVIQFPFIMLSTPDVPKNTMSIRVNSRATFMQLKFNKAVNIFGDMDILYALNMHKISLAQIRQYLPSQDLLKFCAMEE